MTEVRLNLISAHCTSCCYTFLGAVWAWWCHHL